MFAAAHEDAAAGVQFVGLLVAMKWKSCSVIKRYSGLLCAAAKLIAVMALRSCVGSTVGVPRNWYLSMKIFTVFYC